ncbi:MAG: serine/threonine-protein kinase [Paracoccaceae bacterium]
MIDALPGDIFHRGQILNNTYEIEGVLGRGGTGEVYRAKNLISDRIVAIKALNAQFSGQDGYIELMKREEQMRDIRDDAVVRYTECARSDQGHVFLVMDYIAGPSIADEMLRRRLEPRELMIVAHRVAEGLVAAHGQGIVHRDLSPDNIILRDGSAEKATIIDFGIAKDTAAGARTIVGNDFAGKYEYAAPEQMEGRAEARSDLYALGALLLAAWKGQVPFAGMTPGEMIRRKQERLETGGVPEPLKGLIDWLTEPTLAQRAPSAAAVVAQVGKVLKGPAVERGRTAPPTRVATRRATQTGTGAAKRSGSGFLALVLVVLLAAAGGGAWYAGLLQPIIQRLTDTPLPMAAPYSLSASAGATLVNPKLTADAPDLAAANMIRTGFAALAGQAAADDSVRLALGMPTETWASGAAAIFDAARGLEDWQIDLSNMTAQVSGFAPTLADGKAIRVGLEIWAGTYGFTMKLDLATGPRVLEPKAVQTVLDGLANCGPLTQVDPPAGGYALGATITIEGGALGPDLDAAIAGALPGVIGDRQVVTGLTVLNDDICSVRKELPPLPTNALSIWMGQGATGEANLTGVFKTGDNPVVEVLIPASVTQGQLWVMVVDNTHMVFNLVPNANFAETDISKLGSVEGSTRRVRVLFSVSENKADNRLPKAEVNKGDYGKSEIIAFLTQGDFFDTRRPGDESIASFAEDLAKAQSQRPGNIIGFASRILESRP